MDGVFLVGSCFASSASSSKHAESISGVARLWESAQTDRLNEAHWQYVSDQPVNDDLSTDLHTLQRRSVHEAINNPLIEAAIETHQTDIVGDNGPSLQMTTGNRTFDNAIEKLWSDWVEHCEYQHGLALVDLIDGWVGQLWYHGEFLTQDKLGRSASDYKLLDVGADRLDLFNPSATIVMGVEIDIDGRPLAYHITNPSQLGSRSGSNRGTKRVPAQFINHGFRRRFAGQLRGIPFLASSLQTNADLRDYETQVMDAARAAADQAIWFVSDHPEAPYTPWTPESRWNMHRRQGRQAAPGWKPIQMQSHQPSAQYKDYRKEKERDVVIAAQMPLMILRKDSSEHNLSSARYDGVRYTRSITKIQSWFSRRALNRSLERLMMLARLDGTLRIDAPSDGIKLRWAWPKPPSNDPVKDRMAERLGLENGTLSYSEALGNVGARTDMTIAQRVRDNADLEAAGLPQFMGPVPTVFQAPQLPWIEDDAEADAGMDDETQDDAQEQADAANKDEATQ
jgi:lambda family phage portal protein